MLVRHRLSKTIQKIEDHLWKQREKNILRDRNSKQLINYGMCRFVSLYRSTRMINVKDNGQLSNSNVYTVEDIYYLFFQKSWQTISSEKKSTARVTRVWRMDGCFINDLTTCSRENCRFIQFITQLYTDKKSDNWIYFSEHHARTIL